MSSFVVPAKRSFIAMIDNGPQNQEWNQGTSEVPSSRVQSAETTPTKFTVSNVASVPGAALEHTSLLDQGRRDFDSDASIVLVGISGSGKSTLAIMVSVAIGRRVVDVEQQFQRATGFSTAKYRKEFGASNHNLRRDELFRTILDANEKGAVIVCNGALLERSGQALLQRFAKTHPVIHIMRDLDSVHQHLNVLPFYKLQKLVDFITPIFRCCSNFEFYNISETRTATSVRPANQPSVPVFLTLKLAELAFLRFISFILSPYKTSNPRAGFLSSFGSGFPLSEVPVELRKYTCAVQVPLEDLTANVDIEELQLGSDAFEIVIKPVPMDGDLEQLQSERAEYISRAVSLVRRSTMVPIIYHVEAMNDGVSRISYAAHVWYGMRIAPHFVTVDLSMDEHLIRAITAVRGPTKIIGHLHASRGWYDAFWLVNYDAAVRLGCSAVRFTRSAQSTDDDAAIQAFRSAISIRTKTIPLICFNTGRAGRHSACFNQTLTSVVAESIRNSPEFSSRARSQPEISWLSVKDATHALFASFIYEPTKFYVIGALAECSIVVEMYDAAYEVYGMPHRCEAFRTTTLDSLQGLVENNNFGGMGVGKPFKLEMISFVQGMSRHARAIGSVNTVLPVRHLGEEGNIPADLDLFAERNQAGPIKALYGDNTDWIGIMSCIRRGLSPANAVRPMTSGLIIGSGGMARAAVYAMLQIGVQNIVIFNRTYANAEQLVVHFESFLSLPASAGLFYPTFRIMKSIHDPWPNEVCAPTIIVSCVPTHAVGDLPERSFTLPVQWMHSPTGGVVVGMAYGLLEKLPMGQVEEDSSGPWVCLDSLDLLQEVSFPQFELFTGKRAPRRVMREETLRSQKNA